ncbi:MAG: hypothetical protein WB586_09520 [Chthoniobacterales bacterium]
MFMRSDPSSAIQCIEKLAARGAKWQPKERYRFRHFRRASYRADKWRAIDIFEKLLATDVFGDGFFRELMSTPKMKELFSQGYRYTDRIPEAVSDW